MNLTHNKITAFIVQLQIITTIVKINHQTQNRKQNPKSSPPISISFSVTTIVRHLEVLDERKTQLISGKSNSKDLWHNKNSKNQRIN